MRFASVRLQVVDFAACYDFYQEVMGFEPTAVVEGVYAFFNAGASVGIELFVLQDATELARRKAAAVVAEAQEGTVLSFEVGNVDESAQQFEARGVTLIAGATDRPDWGVRTIHFRDPDGAIIEMYQTISKASLATERGHQG